MARFRLKFNQYKPNIGLNGEVRRGFKQEMLIEHFFPGSHTRKRDESSNNWSLLSKRSRS